MTLAWGEGAALTSAALWAVASVGYRYLGQWIPALGLNLAKGLVALGFIGLTLLWFPHFVWSVSAQALGLLLLSGLVGVGLGDSVYFVALNRLGPRETLLITTLAPLFTVGLAFLILDEAISGQALLGTGLTVAGILWVVSERNPHQANPYSRSKLIGIGAALLAALAQAGGAILSRAAFLSTPFDPLYAALIRIAAGVVFLLGLGLSQRQLKHWWQSFFAPPSIPGQAPQRFNLQAGWILVAAAFGGTYLGIWLQQISLKLAPAGISQTLSATSPLFILALAPWLQERVTWRAGLGAVIAVVGVGLVFLSPL